MQIDFRQGPPVPKVARVVGAVKVVVITVNVAAAVCGFVVVADVACVVVAIQQALRKVR